MDEKNEVEAKEKEELKKPPKTPETEKKEESNPRTEEESLEDTLLCTDLDKQLSDVLNLPHRIDQTMTGNLENSID